jgi:hypothetical protein
MRRVALLLVLIFTAIASVDPLYCSDGCTRADIAATSQGAQHGGDCPNLPARIGGHDADVARRRLSVDVRHAPVRAVTSRVNPTLDRTPSARVIRHRSVRSLSMRRVGVEMRVLVLLLAALQVQPSASVELVVSSEAGPVSRAQVVVAGKTVETGSDGRIALTLPLGPVDITVIKEGFNPVTVTVTAVAGTSQVVPVTLEAQSAIEEHVTVSATRTDKRIEDQPMRVEVLDAEEIGEKQLMTPGDIVMMLNEMGGPARAGDVAIARSRERARSRHAGAIHALPVRRTPALWHRRRGPWLTPDSAERPRTGGGDQRRRVRALRGWRARRRRRSDFTQAHEYAHSGRDAESYEPRRHRRRALRESAVHEWLERNDSRRRPLAGAQRRR